MCSGTVLNYSAIKFWQAREAGYPLLSKIAIELTSVPASQAYAERMWRPDGGQAEQNGKKL